ncbi:MAG: methionine--tRNA ligase, partial [Zetaproteobacteria bacterium]
RVNYLSALGWPNEDAPRMRSWPADVHLIGKDILRFHAVYWPALLMAAGLPLPKRIFAHGWWTVEGEKMSKSKGNALKPEELLREYEADVLRYFLLREAAFGDDADFSARAIRARYETELANDIGNLLQRTLAMLARYRNRTLPAPGSEEDQDRALIAEVEHTWERVDRAMDRLQFHLALEAIHALARAGNRYVERNAPWELAKAQSPRLDTVLFHLVELCRHVAVLLSPFMPVKAGMMLAQIMDAPVDVNALSAAHDGGWGKLAPGHRCAKPQPVFPKLG